MSCPFCEIVAGRLDASVVAQTEHALAFLDIRQAVPGHVLVVPKRHVEDIYAIGPELHMEPGAIMEDLKLEADLGIRHRDAWERIAVVTDLDWLKRAFAMFSFMVPGEMKLFAESQMDGAKAWLT